MTDTGRFFGEVESPVMEVMLQTNIFQRLTIYDLQGLCKNVTEIQDEDGNAGAGPRLMTVSKLISLVSEIS